MGAKHRKFLHRRVTTAENPDQINSPAVEKMAGVAGTAHKVSAIDPPLPAVDSGKHERASVGNSP